MPDEYSREVTRIEIVIDADDANPDLLFIMVAARVAKLVEHLHSKGVSAEIVMIEVDGGRHYSW